MPPDDDEAAAVARIAAEAVAWLKRHETQRLVRTSGLRSLRASVRMTDEQLAAAYRQARVPGPRRAPK